MMKENTIVAIYGNHNASVTLAIDGQIIEHVELERLLAVKNVGFGGNTANPELWQTNTCQLITLILDYFTEKYSFEVFDECLLNHFDWSLTTQYLRNDHTQINYRTSHHQAHAACGFYQSPYPEALVFVFDGAGTDYRNNETVHTSLLYHAKRSEDYKTLYESYLSFGHAYTAMISKISEIRDENDLTGNYLAFPGKAMGLAAFGKLRPEIVSIFEKIYDQLGIHANPEINPSIQFNYYFHLFTDYLQESGIPLDENGKLSREDGRDFAAANQYVFEETVLKYLQPYLDQYPDLPIVLSGGCALNVLFNTRLARSREVFVPPNPSDCGVSVGLLLDRLRPQQAVDVTYLGLPVLDKNMLPEYLHNNAYVKDIEVIAEQIAQGRILGVVRGGSELGPRALGNRSILCNPAIPDMKDILNRKVKNREAYRPFAPVVRLEEVSVYFDWEKESRWMNFCPKIRPEYANKIPAVVHADGTCRVQTVTAAQNPWLYDLIGRVKAKTGVGVLLNTSFNIAGKPLLNSYRDAFHMLHHTQMDGIVLEDYLFMK